jgi:hypothetical protein
MIVPMINYRTILMKLTNFIMKMIHRKWNFCFNQVIIKKIPQEDPHGFYKVSQ